MKKIFFKCFLFISFTIILSCEKKTDDKNSNIITQDQKILNSDRENKILDFLSRINGEYKSGGGGYDVDSALWYVEASLNYTYGNASIPFEYDIYDSIFISVNKTNGKISSSDVSDFYNDLVDSLKVRYDKISGTSKHLIIADVSINDDDVMDVDFIIYCAFTYGPPPNLLGDFGDDDYWYHDGGPDNDGGYCDGQYYGEQKNWDAASKIVQKVNYRTAEPSGRYYYTDVIEVTMFPWGITLIEGVEDPTQCDYTNYNDPFPNDNMYDLLLFLCTNYDYNVNIHDCLCPEEMNFYVGGSIEVIDNLVYECSDALGTRVRSYLHIDGVDSSNPPYFFMYYHRYHVYYGNIVFTSTQQNEF